jgi:hypothetical protein
MMDAALASLLVSVLVVAAHAPAASAAPRAFFVFGDSLVDNGNNNYLLTTARADAPPYGIDYPSHRATGRFSNGLNIPDIISNAQLCFLSTCAHACIFHNAADLGRSGVIELLTPSFSLLQVSTSGQSLRCRT